jgi:hypothetical protein
VTEYLEGKHVGSRASQKPLPIKRSARLELATAMTVAVKNAKYTATVNWNIGYILISIRAPMEEHGALPNKELETRVKNDFC